MILANAVRRIRDGWARLRNSLSSRPAHLKLGKLGEDLAVNLLQSQGYRILERNLKVAGREVDIIAMEKDILVIVEVKTRTSGSFGPPLAAVDRKRTARLRKAGEIYAAKKGLRAVSIRFDVVTLDFSRPGEGAPDLIRNAF